MIRPPVPLVIVCGLRRSGSTWVHNAARLILETKGPVWAGFEDQYFLRSAPHAQEAHIVKTHRFSNHLAAASSCILGSVRDLRDVAASAVRRRLTPPGNAAMWIHKVWTEEYARWRPILDYETRYEDILYDQEKAITKLAQVLDVTDADASEISKRLMAGEGYLPHKPADHVTDGQVGTWAQTLDGPTVEEVERTLRPYAPDLVPDPAGEATGMRTQSELVVTVGIVVKNATKSAEKCIRSAGNVPVIVLNNGCFPGHKMQIRKALADCPNVRIIDTESKSLASAWNQLIREARTPWVVLTNDDVRFRPGWLPAFQNAARDPNVHQVHFPAESTYSAFALHKRLVAKIGWFDEGFRGIYYEDEDWYCRLKEYFGNTVQCHIRWLDEAVNSREHLAEDIEIWGSLARDLRKDVNEKHFWQVWRQSPSGVQPKDPKLPPLRRIASVPDPYPDLRRSYEKL